MKITIQDTSFAGKVLHEVALEIAENRITVRELIRQRVIKEVEAYNQKLPEQFQGLIQPTAQEQALNQKPQKGKKYVDAEEQCYVALNAFQQNGFFLLIDQRQCEELDEEILLQEDTQINFIKLTPLIGG